MPINITIRTAARKDIDAMVALLGELFTLESDFQSDPSSQYQGLAMLLDGCMKHKCIQVAESDGQVVGMCTAQILISTAQGTPVALVEDMIVAAGYRRKGIGRRLMQAIELWARSHGATRLQLLADQVNTSALDFYQRMGWCRTKLICLRHLPE